MKFQREAQKHLIKLAKTFRAVAVVGPRQSGKSTLVKSVFKDRPYLSFENTTMVNQFRNDPEYFIQYYKTGCVIDEVQKVPEIFSYLQLEIDTKLAL